MKTWSKILQVSFFTLVWSATSSAQLTNETDAVPVTTESNSEIVKRIEKNVCLVPDASAPAKTEAEGVCLECVFGTQSTPQVSKELTDIELAVRKAAQGKERIQRELAFYQIAETKQLMNQGYGYENSTANLKMQLKNYVEQKNLYSQSLEKNKEIMANGEVIKAEAAKLKKDGEIGSSIKAKFSGKINEGLSVAKANANGYKTTLASLKKQAQLATDSSYLESKLSATADYETGLSTYSIQVADYLAAEKWLQTGGLPIPKKVADMMSSYETEVDSAKGNITSHQISIENYSQEIANLEAKIQKAEAEEAAKLAAANVSAPATPQDKDKEKLAEFEQKGKLQIKAISGNPGFRECGMSTAEILAIQWYTGNNYGWINKALRQGGEEAKKIEPVRLVLNAALKKLALYAGNVGRGTSLPDKELAKHVKGAVVDYPAYTSTAIGSGFPSKHTFVIKSKTGRYVGSHSDNYSEKEVLFAADTKFKILEVDGNKITMEEVSP